MSEYVCTYVVARFVPDPVRDEARNFGVVLQCIDRGFVGCKFEPDLRKRIGSLEAKIVRAYVAEAQKNLGTFRGQSIGLPNVTEQLHPDFLRNLWHAYEGKVQFSEPRGCIADDPERELEELFDLLVAEEPFMKPKAKRRPSVAREVGNYFRQSKLLGKTRVQEDYPVVVRGQQIPFDFGYKHPTRESEVLIETVDLTHESLRDRIHALSPAAVKFEMLKEARKGAVTTVSIVKTHPNGNGRTYALEFKELRRHADQLVDLSKAAALEGVIRMVQRDFGRATKALQLYN